MGSGELCLKLLCGIEIYCMQVSLDNSYIKEKYFFSWLQFLVFSYRGETHRSGLQNKACRYSLCVPPEVYSGGLVDTSDETLETLLRTVVTGHRLI